MSGPATGEPAHDALRTGAQFSYIIHQRMARSHLAQPGVTIMSVAPINPTVQARCDPSSHSGDRTRSRQPSECVHAAHECRPKPALPPFRCSSDRLQSAQLPLLSSMRGRPNALSSQRQRIG